MNISKYKKSSDGKFYYLPTALKLPKDVILALLKERERMGTPLARQISEILLNHFQKNKSGK